MRKSVVKFSERLIVVCGAVSIVAALLLGHFVGPRILAYAIAAYAAVWSLRSLGAEVTVTRTFLSRKNLFGEQRMAWDEMDLVEVTGDANFWFVFHSGDRRISMPGPVTSMLTIYNEDDDHEDGMATLLLDLAGEHGVPVAGSWIAPFKTSKA